MGKKIKEFSPGKDQETNIGDIRKDSFDNIYLFKFQILWYLFCKQTN